MSIAHQLLGALIRRFDHGVHRLVEVVVANPAVKMRGMTELVDRPLQPLLDLLRRLTPPLHQPLRQHARVAGEDENRDGIGRQFPDLLRAVHFDVQQDMATRLENVFDVGPQRAVQLARVFRMFQKLSLLDTIQELARLPEPIVDPVLLARARLSRRRRHRKPKPVRIAVAHCAGDRRLAATRWRGQNDDARDGGHSKFSNCSRNFSRSPFIAITVCVIRASFAFDPIVLTSRSATTSRAARSTIPCTSAHVTGWSLVPFVAVNTSGCRATKARSTVPFSFSFFLSSCAAARTCLARTKSTVTARSGPEPSTQRAVTATCPRSSSCRSRSRISISTPARSAGSFSCGLK